MTVRSQGGKFPSEIGWVSQNFKSLKPKVSVEIEIDCTEQQLRNLKMQNTEITWKTNH